MHELLGIECRGIAGPHLRPSTPSRMRRARSIEAKIWSLHPPSGSTSLTRSMKARWPCWRSDVGGADRRQFIEHSRLTGERTATANQSEGLGDGVRRELLRGSHISGAGWWGSWPAGGRRGSEGRSWRRYLVGHPQNPVPKVWIAGFRRHRSQLGRLWAPRDWPGRPGRLWRG